VADERAVATVALAAVSGNCARLRSALTGGARLCAVVKADAYGHGAAECARAALDGGATSLAVATAREAAVLREGGISARTLVMGALTRAEIAIALEAEADVVAWTPEFLRSLPRGARVHVKLDTGMGRLGARDPRDAVALADALAERDGVELAGLMTHFATADEVGDEHFPAQLDRFARFVHELRVRHPGVPAHAANSAATLRDPGAHFDMVRCGVAVYGLDPFQRDPREHGLQPALELRSYVASVRRLETGDGAGYGRRFVASRPTWLATLPIGYADGWRRALTNNCDVLLHGRRHPLVGTVSMDNIAVDLGANTDIRAGDEAVLVGVQGDERITAEEVAGRLDTINYEVACGIGPRVPRRYR